MDAAEQAHKLAMIRELSGAEVLGWHRYCTRWREPFPGEMAALLERALQTGVTLPPSSHDAQSG